MSTISSVEGFAAKEVAINEKNNITVRLKNRFIAANSTFHTGQGQDTIFISPGPIEIHKNLESMLKLLGIDSQA